ncbi:MAG: nucleotide sugar dehydrogenase [Nitrospirae bacterium]|nr:nucleotide sugar dehydrogenase [Nitrospirota bacterium]
MKIAIIGTGYVGLTTGACLADVGHDVFCVDIDKEKIENLKKGIIPIYEPGLEKLVRKNKINFTTDPAEAIKSSEIIISAVGTPMGRDHNADLKYVKEVAKTFGIHANNHKVFINKSTVPVGTGEMCKTIINEEFAKRNADFGFEIISNPEFLREGTAIQDTMKPDRIVIGTESEKAQETMKKLYDSFDTPILFTDIKTAEIIKYAANSFLATKISFINEIADFCEHSGGNIKDVAKGIGLDKRIGDKFLNAGIGYGGSCLPKDVKALIQKGQEFNCDFSLLKAAEEINKSQKLLLFKKLQKHLGSLEGKLIGIWGLSFKPKTDDMREAPSLTIIKNLQSSGAYIKAYDPKGTENAKKLIETFNIDFSASALEAAKEVDALLILTEWQEFIDTDLQALKSTMKTPLILDGRNIFNKSVVEKAGFKYVGIGQSEQKTPELERILEKV